jgi:KTSC domain-containing protein
VKHAPVQSTSLRSVAYDPAAKVLHVSFHSGKTYAYHDVPAQAHADLMAAKSVGGHFSASIRNVFRSTPIGE